MNRVARDSPATSQAPRTVIVGDVHGCSDELEELLEKTRFADAVDRLVFVGDLVVRGPDPHGVLALAARLGARAARGNHENKLLTLRGKGGRGVTEHDRLAAELTEVEWRFIEAMPLWLDLPDHGVRVVHAGVVPGQVIEDTPAEALMTMRAIDARGRYTSDKDASPLWGAVYTGPPHVIFGHNALSEPQLHPWATGLDTGCVYGRRLSALVLGSRETVPRGALAAARIESVPAHRAYAAVKPGTVIR